VYVHPGHLHVSGGPGFITTILGSCVSVCLHDPVARVGGLNHFLLPTHTCTDETSLRYGTPATEQLLQQILARGALKKRLVAHLVGGASVLAAFGRDEHHLGTRNVDVARAVLIKHRIPVMSADVGGTRGRKLLFSPRDGTREVHLIGA